MGNDGGGGGDFESFETEAQVGEWEIGAVAMAEYRAVLFDMDGVLVDSEPLFLRAINRVVTETGNEPISEAENEEYLLGTTVVGTWEQLKRIRHLPDTIEAYIERYDETVREVLFHELVPQPGVVRLLEECERRGLPKAVASSSRRDWLQLKLAVSYTHLTLPTKRIV